MAKRGRNAGPLARTEKLKGRKADFSQITMGEVVDTNDPQQMGRLRIACPLFGDLTDTKIEDIPWASYVAPFAGSSDSPSRGRGDDVTHGPIAYGMFNIPKVGSLALVACIDGDPRFRVWFGCMHDQLTPHTMPHGRYSYKTDNQPDGPLSSSENKIEPLYSAQTAAFTNSAAGVDARQSYEFRTRGADQSVAGLGDEFVKNKKSNISWLSDDVDEAYEGGHTNTQGYGESRVEPGQESSTTGTLRDPQTYSWSTPGFHSISMHDVADHCRMRFRTTHGHQIILDDTNERIYVSTANGKTWVELDEAGNIDVYAERNISFHAKKDINFTTDQAFRVTAEEGIHLSTPGETRIYAESGVHVKSETTLNLHAEDDLNILSAGGNANITSFVDTNVNASGSLIMTASEIHENGPPAATVSDSATSDAYLTSRVPDHEPWARTMTKDDTTHDPELAYDDANVGKSERGESIARNDNWQR